jgi:hypothetical protein
MCGQQRNWLRFIGWLRQPGKEHKSAHAGNERN